MLELASVARGGAAGERIFCGDGGGGKGGSGEASATVATDA